MSCHCVGVEFSVAAVMILNPPNWDVLLLLLTGLVGNTFNIAYLLKIRFTQYWLV